MAEKKKDEAGSALEPPKDATPAQVREFEVYQEQLKAAGQK